MTAAAPAADLATALAHGQQLLRSDPALAAEQAGEVLRVLPGQPQALALLAEARLALGEGAAALTLLQPLATQQPHWGQLQRLLARALQAQGQGEAALTALQRAVQLQPDLPGVWRELGDALSAVGDQAGADAAYVQHTRFSSRDPELLAAAAALLDNRIPEAEARLRARLRQAPNDVAGLRMLAEVAARIGRIEDAETLLARCLALAPGFAEARQHYAQVLLRGNQPERALAEVERLLGSEPDNPSYRNLQAVLLCRTGEFERALPLYASLLAEYPQQARIWLSYGHALKTAGRTAEAIAGYRRAAELQPALGEAWWSLANLKTFRFAEADVAAMRAGQAGCTDPEQHLQFEFALGKAQEDAGAYAAAFAHYARGNAARKRLQPYRAEQTTARLARAAQLFDRGFFEVRRDWGAAAGDPIFVVGLPRSGSTLVEQILASHPAIEGTMELPEVISLARELRGRGSVDAELPYYDALCRASAADCRALGERYLERTRIQRKSAAAHFVDKMPNNFAHIALIQLALPNAKIVDVRRHPLACCFSGFKQHFARGQNFSYDLGDLGHYYRDYVQWMAHVDTVLPGRVHRLIYEQLVADTEGEVRRLLDYLGLAFDPACLAFHTNARPVRTASSEQVRQPINRAGIDHWQHFEPWLEPLKTALGPVLSHYPAVPNFVAGHAND